MSENDKLNISFQRVLRTIEWRNVLVQLRGTVRCIITAFILYYFTVGANEYKGAAIESG